MAAQLAGATLIAWLTVRWALGRYRSEKMWERETTEIFGLLTTLAELDVLISDWLSEEYDYRDRVVDKDHETLRLQRYRGARAQLRAARSISDVILPQKFVLLFEELEVALDASPDDGDYAEAYESELKVLRNVRSEIVLFGKQRLRVTSK